MNRILDRSFGLKLLMNLGAGRFRPLHPFRQILQIINLDRRQLDLIAII